MDSYPIEVLVKASNAKPALDPNAQGFSAASQHRFKLLHFRQQIGGGRAWQTIAPPGGVNIAVMKRNAGEVPSLAAGSLYRSRGLVRVFKVFVYLKFF